MPVLEKTSAPIDGVKTGARRLTQALFPVCSNPTCASGWLHVWRGRQNPVFEGGWVCSPECMQERVRAAVLREVEGRDRAPRSHVHRVPLGLALLAQGAITPEQLKSALEQQRASRRERLGSLLMQAHGLDERHITRALSMQWSCPVFNLEHHSPERVAPLVPRLFLDAFGILPLRVAGGKLFYIAFEDRIDHCVTFGLERMTGLRVEAGVLDGAAFRDAHARMLGERFPRTRLVEVAGVEALISTLTRILESGKPSEARLVRLHDYYWLRFWSGAAPDPAHPRLEAVEDVLCSIGDFRA